jgi:putative transposase
VNELRVFNPYAEVRQTENRLPHWQQQGAVYFITFRLADAVPEALRAQWESERSIWLRLHPEP